MSTIQVGAQIEKDPSDDMVMVFNWDDFYPPEALLADVGTFTLSRVDVVEDPVLLLIDNISMVSGSRKVRFRLTGGLAGALYQVAHFITFNTTPQERRERSFYVWVHEL